MKKKKGFTLVELLAVIVILAIIALVTIPIILNMISKSRKRAAVAATYGYVDAIEYSISLSDIKDDIAARGILGNMKLTIPNKKLETQIPTVNLPDNTTEKPSYTVEEIDAAGVRVKGKKPTSGNVTITKRKVSHANICIGGYIVDYNGKEATVQDKCSSSTEIAEVVNYEYGDIVYFDPKSEDTCDASTFSIQKIKNKTSTCYKWRVINTDGDNLTLQMDHNMISSSSWGSTEYNKSGPDVALIKLANETKDWTRVEPLNYEYDTSAADSNYGKMKCTDGICSWNGFVKAEQTCPSGYLLLGNTCQSFSIGVEVEVEDEPSYEPASASASASASESSSSSSSSHMETKYTCDIDGGVYYDEAYTCDEQDPIYVCPTGFTKDEDEDAYCKGRVTVGTSSKPVRARMITGEEITTITKTKAPSLEWTLASQRSDWYYFSHKEYIIGTRTKGTGNKELSWLLENAGRSDITGASTNFYNSEHGGYITLSPSAKNDEVWMVSSSGNLYSSGITGFALKIRPVITISKSAGITKNHFASDSWATIASNTTSDRYKVGDEKEVKINNKSYIVRITNKSKPNECKTTGFSQTACGFVIEFADIFATQNINAPSQCNSNYYEPCNLNGWPASARRQYLNGNFYNSLPSDLKSVIIDTTVVSGYERGVANNYVSTDKIYLLSTKEVGFDLSNDTAKDETRILDYYNLNTDSSSRVKYDYENKTQWWLRTAYSDNITDFFIVDLNGSSGHAKANSLYGIAPAFRIGTN